MLPVLLMVLVRYRTRETAVNSGVNVYFSGVFAVFIFFPHMFSGSRLVTEP